MLSYFNLYIYIKYVKENYALLHNNTIKSIEYCEIYSDCDVIDNLPHIIIYLDISLLRALLKKKTVSYFTLLKFQTPIVFSLVCLTETCR